MLREHITRSAIVLEGVETCKPGPFSVLVSEYINMCIVKSVSIKTWPKFSINDVMGVAFD